MADIALTAAMRKNLLSLQGTQKLMDMTSDRLSTGRKVNSALDNPSSFFTAKGLTNRAGDLSSLLDAMGQGLQTLKAAEKGMDSITDLVNQAKAVADEAYEAAAAADKGSTLTINDAAVNQTRTLELTAGSVIAAGAATAGGTITFTTSAGVADTITIASGTTATTLAAFINSDVDGLTASFDDDTGKLEITMTATAESFSITDTGAGSSVLETAKTTLQDDAFVDVKANTQLYQTAGSSGTVTIVTEDGAKTYSAGSGSTVGDLVDWINNEVGGVSAKVGANGLELTGDTGFTTEGLDSTTLDLGLNDDIDGHRAGRTLTFGVKSSDLTTVAAGATMTVDGTTFSIGGVSSGAELMDKLDAGLGSDWEIGTNSDGYVTLTYAGTSTDTIDYSASSSTGVADLFLNDGSTSTSTFNGNFNVSGTVDNDNLISQYNDLLAQIDTVVADSGYKGINLLNGSDLTVNFNEDRTSSLTISGVEFDSEGLSMSSASGWKTTSSIQSQLDEATAAIETIRDQTAKFGRDGAVIQTRQDFTQNMINTLQEGADNLTLADMNEEGANMLALQTRQQLATSSLSMASQASQAVLSLFR